MLWDGMIRRAFGSDDGEKPQGGSRLSRPPPKIGLALGGGAARGWAHIGILEVLREEGIRIDVVAGTSIGAVVGGCHAAGRLSELKEFALSLTKRRVLSLMDFQLGGSGLIAGERLKLLLRRNLAHRSVESLPQAFTAIATEVGTGHEIWLTRGALVEALCASYALPGIFPPCRIAGRLLMDGALVNPVPVTAARAMGANLVVAVNLNGDLRLRGTIIQSHGGEDHDEMVEAVLDEPPRRFSRWFSAPQGPALTSTMIDAFNITQDRIARSRLAGDPPDILVVPKLGTIGLFEFHRASEAIAAGRQAMERLVPDLRELMRESVGT